MILGNGLSQMFATAKLAKTVNWVQPETFWQRETRPDELATSNFGRGAGIYAYASTSTISTARCGPACRVMCQGSGQVS